MALVHMNCSQLSSVSIENGWYPTYPSFIYSLCIITVIDSGRIAQRVAQLLSHHSPPPLPHALNCDGRSRKHGLWFHPIYGRLRGATVIGFK